jgi:ketosteroid isomerase-like protein
VPRPLAPVADGRTAFKAPGEHAKIRSEANGDPASEASMMRPGSAWAVMPITGEEMLTENEARKFATHWIQAWNSRDLDEIMSHYGPKVVLVSPAAAKILNDPSGTVKGKEALQMYFQRGLETYPDLKFELVDVMWGLSSIVLYYVNQKGTKTGEFMEFDASGKVIRVVANYSG